MDLSTLVDSYLNRNCFPKERDRLLISIERWMHHGLNKSNAKLIFQNLQKLFPVAYLHRLARERFSADRKTSALWASLLAAFMDTKCWCGYELSAKDAVFCELNLIGAHLYLVDVVLQMSSKDQRTFFAAICRRLFSSPASPYQDVQDSLRLIIFYKWLTLEHQKIQKPSLKYIAERCIHPETLEIFLTEQRTETFEVSKKEQVLGQLLDSYSLAELVILLEPSSMQNVDDFAPESVEPDESHLSDLDGTGLNSPIEFSICNTASPAFTNPDISVHNAESHESNLDSSMKTNPFPSESISQVTSEIVVPKSPTYVTMETFTEPSRDKEKAPLSAIPIVRTRSSSRSQKAPPGSATKRKKVSPGDQSLQAVTSDIVSVEPCHEIAPKPSVPRPRSTPKESPSNLKRSPATSDKTPSRRHSYHLRKR